MTTPAISKLQGTPYLHLKTPTMSPEQQQLFSQVLGGTQKGLTGGLDQLTKLAAGGSPEYWEQLEAPAMRQFQELQGQLASRFSGLGGQGSTGARRSSGFQNAASSSAVDLAERLQSQRLGLSRDAVSQLMDLYKNLMGTQTFDTAFLPKQQKRSFLEELLPSLLGSVANFGGNLGGSALTAKILSGQFNSQNNQV